jgi:hypothetical protein
MPVVCPRRKIPDFLGPDLHPAQPNDDVSPSAWPSWLSFTPATTPINGDRGARPPTFKGDSRKTQAPPPREFEAEGGEEEAVELHAINASVAAASILCLENTCRCIAH